jgi:hypothetical protein
MLVDFYQSICHYNPEDCTHYPKVLPYLFLLLIFIPEISGSVMARVPNGITGEWCRLLLSARRTGESKIGGSMANGPLRSGELAPVVSKHFYDFWNFTQNVSTD